MRLCRFGADRLGLVRDGLVHDITELQAAIRAEAPFTLQGDPVIAALPDWRERFERHADRMPGIDLETLALLSPVARPSKLMAAPTNYATHIAEMAPARAAGGSKHSADIGKDGIFLKANSALVGPSEGVPIRFPDRRTDHELELVFVIGRRGTDIPAERALDHVAGYALGLDMVIRGPEDRSFRKSCDGYAVLGPWLVTADEISDPDNIDLNLSVNGEPRQRANTRDLVYKVRRLIEFASSFYTLHPGDVFYTGTPHGVGPVRPGDTIALESPSIGAMRVPVRAHVPGQSQVSDAQRNRDAALA